MADIPVTLIYRLNISYCRIIPTSIYKLNAFWSHCKSIKFIVKKESQGKKAIIIPIYLKMTVVYFFTSFIICLSIVIL